MNVLVRIKRALIAGRYVFTSKAQMELDVDGLSESDVIEAILSADSITKTIKSNKPSDRGEPLYIIIHCNLVGIEIYTKGKLMRRQGEDVYYVLISSKRAE